MKQKKVPLRRCIGCYEMKEKKELVRIVKNKENEVSVDTTGKQSGRGAYLCKCTECFLKVRKGKKIEKTFEMRIIDDVYNILEQQMEGLSE